MVICDTNDMSFEHGILQHTGGRGVDMILNTRVDNFTEATINCLVKGGKFIQIKKADLRNSNLNGNKSVFNP